MRIWLLGLVLIFVVNVNAGWWLTIPSAPTASGGCGSLATESYFWDTQDSWWLSGNGNDWSGTIPKGDYGENILQYFCTANVDSLPLGSYCFYQNRQNSQSCPSGFTEGTRTQCDDDDGANQSGPKGNSNTLPKKDQLNDFTTKWYFCCGNGSPSTSISFDSIRSQLHDTFVLFRKGGSCQVINGRNSVQTGWVYWDDEDGIDSGSYSNAVTGTIPDGSYGSNTQIQYCTYGPIPFPPTNLQLTQKTSTSVSISWTASAGSGIYYKIITSSTTSKYSSTSTTWNSLLPSTNYTFYIYAGKNNPSNSAETYETVGTSFQFTTCNNGYSGLNCDPVCNPTCVHGNCIAPNQCSCNIGWSGSACNECTNGYYPNGSGSCLQCSNCNNHGVCSDGPSGTGLCTCSTGYTTPESSSDYCLICSGGYVMENSICVRCFETCETCEFNSTYCTSCKEQYVLQGNNKCASDCEIGTYFDGNTCTECPNSCLTCYGGSEDKCLSCPSEKVLESGSCLSNCSNGNYPDSNHICQGCQYPCLTCIGPENGECLSCISPTIRNGTTCISESQCNQNGFIDSNRDCQGCNSTCLTCYGPNGNQCISCPIGIYLLNGECKSCPSGYYSNSTSNTCQSCNSQCLECFGPNENECSSCNFPLLLNSTSCISTLECLNFGYKDDTFCRPCDESCLKCSGPLSTDCMACPGSKYLLNGECLDDCPFGYFTSGSQCQICSYPCLSCIGESNSCLDCIDSFVLNQTTCISNDQCLKNGYISNDTCFGCNSDCSTCYGSLSNNCLSCHEPKVLLEGTCVDSCPSNYFVVNQTNSCQECDSSCVSCSGGGENDCLSCNNSLYIENGRCVNQCSIGFYQNNDSHTCDSCPNVCLACSSLNMCSSCIPNYSLYGGECVYQCPNGFSSNNAICSQTEDQTQNQVGLGVGLTFGLVFLILLAILVLLFIKRQKKKQMEKFSEISMEKRDIHFSELSKRDRFSSRKVTNESQRSITVPGQNTLLNTGIEFESFPAFLMLNFGLDFRIEKEIGKGGSGSLSICRILNEETKDMFKTGLGVVKILNQKNEEENQNFLNEISITWSLSFHSNIVQLIGYCEEPRCILTKLYERDLFSLLHDPNEEIEASRMIELCLCIIKGVERIHQIGIAHRDLKTKNILIERGQTNEQKDIRAVICDFGLAVTNKNIQTAPFGISPQYASPEIFNSVRFKTQLDLKGYQKGDLFSFGVIIWEIITRQIPWNNSALEEIEFSIREGKRLKIEEVDNSLDLLKQIMQQCWKEDPQSRPTPSLILQTFPK